MSPAVQSVFSPPPCSLLQPILRQFAYRNLTGYSVKHLTKTEIKNIHDSPLIHQGSHLITEYYQVGQAWLPHHKSMLTAHRHHLVLHCLEMVSRNIAASLFLAIEVRPVVPRILLLSFLEDRCLLSSSPQEPPSVKWPSQDDWEWPCDLTGWLPQRSWVHTIRLIPVCSLTWSSTIKGDQVLQQGYDSNG